MYFNILLQKTFTCDFQFKIFIVSEQKNRQNNYKQMPFIYCYMLKKLKSSTTSISTPSF